jgi:hypothetical protein
MELEETFGIKPNSGRILRQLNGIIGVDLLTLHPGQWMVCGLQEEPIAMDDELFKALFEPVPEMHTGTTEDMDGYTAAPTFHPSEEAPDERNLPGTIAPLNHPSAAELSAADPGGATAKTGAGTKQRKTNRVK